MVRLDKNIAHNIDYFGGLMEEAEHVTVQLVYYFCETYQYNIFGFGILDPDEFAAKYQLDRFNLKRKAKDPVQLHGKTEMEIKAMYDRQAKDPGFRIFDSVLENALYILLSRNIVLMRGGRKVVQRKSNERSNEEEVIYDKLTSVQVLKELEVVFTKSRGGKKVLYRYVLNPDIVGNLTEYFLVSAKENLVDLRSNKSERLYLFLLDLRDLMYVNGHTSTTIENTPSFAELCHIAGVEITYRSGTNAGCAKDAKYVKRDLKQKLDYLITYNRDKNFSFTYRFVHSPGHRWAYTCLFNFAPRHGSVVEDKEWRNMERRNIFVNNFLYGLLDCFKRLNSRVYFDDFNMLETAEKMFLKWVTSDTHIEEKISVYIDAQVKTYHRLSYGVKVLANQFVSRLCNERNGVCSVDDLKKYLFGNN
ncbi:MAG: hypothetical protein LBR79_06835 [Oscillospiraceae bacterium]|nr:hypothetical protein [Oscillospiraceae bacterium]